MLCIRLAPTIPAAFWVDKSSRRVLILLVPFLSFLSLLLATPVPSQAMKYITPADFPPAGGLLTISEETTLRIGVGEEVTIDFDINVSGPGKSFLVENQGSLLMNNTEFQITDSGACTINNMAPNGILTLVYSNAVINNGALSIHNQGAWQDHINSVYSVTLTGQTGTFTVENDGQMVCRQVTLQVYGGTILINNRNSLSGLNWYIKDQFDGTQINNSGSLAITNTTLVSNGRFGSIQVANEGTARFKNLTLDANYGGQIAIDTTTGRMIVWNLSQDASGASHGQVSKITILGTIFNRELFLPLILSQP